MTEIVGEAVLVIKTDDTQVDKGAENAGKKAGKKYTSGFSAGIKGLAAAVGVSFATATAVDFLKAGIADATSLQDEMGALNVIVGEEGTAAIEKFADASASAFGISKVDALEAAHTFSTFGKSAGLAGTDLAEFSTDFASLAGDLASFNGGSTEDAITAIGGALRGETESIRRYGVLLDDATLRQSALRLGLIKTTKQALTPQQKVLAAQAEIYRQTKDAQGDFARTSDSAANSQKKLTAQIKDLRTEAGQKLLPIVTDVVREVSDFIREMDEGTGAGGRFADGLSDVADIAGDVFALIGQVVGLIDELPGPVKKFGAEILLGAVAINKLQTATSGLNFTGLVSGLSSVETKAGTTKTALQRVGGAAKNAAGAAGLVALTASASETNEALSTLEATAGAAAVGFAVGGPTGAAVAGSTALFYKLITAMNETSDVVDGLKEGQKDFAGTLVAGEQGINRYTRALAVRNLTESKAIERGRELKLSSKTIVDAALGNAKAQREVERATRAASDAYDAEGITYDKNGKLVETAAYKANQRAAELNTSIYSQAQLLKQNTIKVNEAALAAGEYGKVLGGIPKEAQTRIDQVGLEQASENIISLTAKYNLTPKQVRTVLEAAGDRPTKDKINKVIERAKILDAQEPTVNAHANTKQARDDLNALINSLRTLNSLIPGAGQFGLNLFSGAGFNAGGTQNWRGGLSWVGERGPELVNLPRGAQVYPADQSRRMAQASTAPAAPQIIVQPANVQVTQQYFGPTTSGGRLRELEWTMKYAVPNGAVRAAEGSLL